MSIESGLYFIQDAEGPIKIGRYSGSIKARMKTLQTGNPRKLNLIHNDRECSFVNETVVHCCLTRHRIRNEWFHPCEDVLSVISTFKTVSSRMELFYRLRDIYKPPVFYAIERNKHGRIPDIKWLKERVRQAEARAARSSSE